VAIWGLRGGEIARIALIRSGNVPKPSFLASDSRRGTLQNVKKIILVLRGMLFFERIWSQLLFTDSQKLAVGRAMNQDLRIVALTTIPIFPDGFGFRRRAFLSHGWHDTENHDDLAHSFWRPVFGWRRIGDGA
jgi:hypothetical protein